MATTTFGVDATYVQSFLPQLTVEATAPLTSARLTVIIKRSAARINGLMLDAGLTPSDIAADTTTVTYDNAAGLVFAHAQPHILAAAHGSAVVQAEVTAFEEAAAAEIQKWIEKPGILGDDISTTRSPGVRTSSQGDASSSSRVWDVRGGRQVVRSSSGGYVAGSVTTKYQPRSEKGQASGYASLGADGVLVQAVDIIRTTTGDTDLAVGAITDGQFLKRDGSTIVSAAGGGGSGDVVGPASATDNAVARYDSTTGKLIQDSAVTIDDSGNIATSGTVDGRDLSTDGSKLDGIEALADVTDATNVDAAGAVMETDAAGGDLGGTYPSPSVAALTTTTGPTSLTIGAIADGEALVRSGTDIIGGTPGGTDANAIHDNVAAEISAISAKAIPGLSDYAIIEDEANSDAKASVQFKDVAVSVVAIQAQKGSVGTITAGQCVYLDGYDVGAAMPEVELADSDAGATMPAIGIARTSIGLATTGEVLVSGRLGGIDTSAWSAGDELYVSGTAGDLTSTKPTGTAAIQKMAQVLRSHATLGEIEVFGAGRSNDIPYNVNVLGTLQVDGNVGFYGTSPVAQSAAYTPTNVSSDRSYNANATSIDELADVLGTLIADLQATGLIG